MKISFEAPLNQISFGNVSYNFLKEFYKISQKDSSFSFVIHPIGEVNLSSFDKIEKDFADWIQSCLNNRFKFLTKDTISLKLWHLNGAQNRICPKQVLYTFYELDEPTDVERCIVGLQDTTIFSSANSARSFALEKFTLFH